MIELDVDVQRFVRQRKIGHAIHFTQSRNLVSILRDGQFRSVRSLEGEDFKTYSESDPVRADGHRDKINLSIQYPNIYYMNIVKDRVKGFRDWVIFLLEPDVLAIKGTLFSRFNAAKRGAFPVPGVSGLEACFAEVIDPGNGRVFERAKRHDPRCPTDLQAEALVPSSIPVSMVRGVVVPSESDARQERRRLELLQADPDRLRWYVAPGFFSREAVLSAAQRGVRIPGRPYGEVGAK